MRLARTCSVLAKMAVVAAGVALLNGCAKPSADETAVDPERQAQAAQSSVESALAVQRQRVVHVQPAADAGAATGQMAVGRRRDDRATTDQGSASALPPTTMARMLGQPPVTSSSSGGGAMGPIHIYHVAASSFFLDQVTALGLTREQQHQLRILAESAALAYATTQRKIEQGEQDLWVLASSPTPNMAKIEAQMKAIARLSVEQRMDFMRTVEEAVGVLSHEQHEAVVAQIRPGDAGAAPSVVPPGAPPAPSGMITGAAADGRAGAVPDAGMPMSGAAAGSSADGGSAAMEHM